MKNTRNLQCPMGIYKSAQDGEALGGIGSEFRWDVCRTMREIGGKGYVHVWFPGMTERCAVPHKWRKVTLLTKVST